MLFLSVNTTSFLCYVIKSAIVSLFNFLEQKGAWEIAFEMLVYIASSEKINCVIKPLTRSEQTKWCIIMMKIHVLIIFTFLHNIFYGCRFLLNAVWSRKIDIYQPTTVEVNESLLFVSRNCVWWNKTLPMHRRLITGSVEVLSIASGQVGSMLPTHEGIKKNFSPAFTIESIKIALSLRMRV